MSRKYEASIQPLIGWDTQDININNEFPLFEFDSLEAPAENSNINKSVKDSTPEIMPTRIENNTSNDTSSELNIKGKSKSKKTNKSQQPTEKKSKPKSKTKKAAKSSAVKNVDQTNVNFNLNGDNLLASDEPLSVKARLENPNLQLDIASDNHLISDDSISTIISGITASTSPILEDESTLFRNIANDELAESELSSSLPSAELSGRESISQLQEENELDENTSELPGTSLGEFTEPNNEEIFTQSIIPNNEQQVVAEVLESFNISDIPVSPTPSKQNIETSLAPSIVDNQTTASPTNLIQAKKASPSLNSPSPTENLSQTNSSFEAIKDVGANLISESTTNDFVTVNGVADNFLENAGFSSAFTLDDVDEAPTILHPLADDENTVEADVTVRNSESSVAKSAIKIQQEIGSSVTSEPPAIAPVQLTPTSVDVTATSSEIDEALLPATSPEIDELPIVRAISPEIDELPIVRAISPEIDELPVVRATSSEIVEEPLPSPEIDELPVIRTTSSEIIEEPVPTTSPEIDELPVVRAISPEIDELPVIRATSSEIVEEPLPSPEIDELPIVRATSSEIIEEPFPTTSPEIDELPVVRAISPEIDELPIVRATSSEIIEEPVPTTSSEIDELPVVRATSPEIIEEPLRTTSPEIGETASIFREIIDNEPTVESEFFPVVTNPEMSTFVDTSENPTSPQNEVSTPPEVEQNAIAENLPALKGYATGGQVTDSRVEIRQQIAPSDTVPAMLTPGEFVINTRDAQKHLPLLHHINTGGTPQDIILPSLQTPNATEPEETTSPETPTKVDSFPDTSLQLKSAETDSPQISNSLIPSSLGLNISRQKLSILNSPQLNPLQNETIGVDEPSPQYSSPPMIFRKVNPTNNTPSQWSNTPSQWSSVEDLLNGNNDEFTNFNFSGGESNSQNSEFSHASESPQVFAKHLPSFRGFADGGEVTPPDISREIQPVTETIESASLSSQGNHKDDPADLEALAREIYHRLRQRIEIERERHGGSSGRLSW
ncbi:MAG: hypothetical protein V7K50_19865 [Nostoc sp.]|uniref:hypothetical protein n=1 Tax=Nostoc sp. TaxID=1180 RepID=UPI002FF53E36